jgi:hypothetical protein
MSNEGGITALKVALEALAPGRLCDDAVRRIEHLLIDCWAILAGSRDGGMEGYKISGRTEDMTWAPPILTFRIERHPARMMRSIYDDIQTWGVDVSIGVANLISSRKRQSGAKAASLGIKPLADEIAMKVTGGAVDPRLTWLSPIRVKLEIGRIIPSTNEWTTSDRRR